MRQEPKNIVIRMPNWLGDAVMATPILHDIRKNYPEAKITILCSDVIAQLFANNPHLDALLTFSRKTEVKKKEGRRIVQKLIEGNYDLGILLTGSFSSAWQFFRAKIPLRLGYSTHFRKFLLTHPVAIPEHDETQHLVISYKQLLAPLGMAVSDTPLELFVSNEEKKAATELLASFDIHDDHRLIGINPGAAYGSAKCWPKERFRKLSERLLQDPKIRILYFGDSHSKALVDDICMGLPLRVNNLAGKTTLRELIALIDACSLLITNDSGPMHIGAAVHTPLVAIFGSTNAIKTGPYSNGKVVQKHVPCSPCYLRKCPIDFRCMMNISVDDVVEAL